MPGLQLHQVYFHWAMFLRHFVEITSLISRAAFCVGAYLGRFQFPPGCELRSFPGIPGLPQNRFPHNPHRSEVISPVLLSTITGHSK
jgi:hypothetical protein